MSALYFSEQILKLLNKKSSNWYSLQQYKITAWNKLHITNFSLQSDLNVAPFVPLKTFSMTWDLKLDIRNSLEM